MEKVLLCQYSQMVKEARDLQQRIKKIKAVLEEYQMSGDFASVGRRSKRSLGRVRIEGTNDRDYSFRKTEYLRLLLLYENLLDRITQATADVEEFIQTIDDSRIRQIIRTRYTLGADGKLTSWVKVAFVMHETEDSCRKAHDRYLASA